MKNPPSHFEPFPALRIAAALLFAALSVACPGSVLGQEMTFEQADAFMDEALTIARKDPAAAYSFLQEEGNRRTSMRIAYDFIQKQTIEGRILGMKRLQLEMLRGEAANLGAVETSLDQWKPAAEELKASSPKPGSLEAIFLGLYDSVRQDLNQRK